MARKIKEVALCLSGGGARGAYHLGVLHYLDEQNIKVKAICATSIGSIVAASYAAGVAPKDQLEILKSKEIKKLFKFNWFKRSIFEINMEADVLNKLAPISDLQTLHIPLHITAVELESGEEKVFNHGDTHTICKASSALSPIFAPVSIDDKVHIDGGFRNHIPVAPLLNYNLPIIGVNLHPFVKNKKTDKPFEILKRTITLSMDGNVQVAKKLCEYFIESPEITNYSILSLKNFDALFELGYQEAHNVLMKNVV